MEILITGGNGFLGRHLILALQERGFQVSLGRAKVQGRFMLLETMLSL